MTTARQPQSNLADSNPGTTPRVGHIYLDGKRRVVQCLNQMARQLHAEGVPLTPADLKCQPLLTLEGHTVTSADLPLVAAMRQGSAVEAHFVLPREGGVPWRVSWNVVPVRDAQDQIIGVLGSVTCSPPEPDWQMMAELAHDLRTPLQAIQLIGAIIDQLPPEKDELRHFLEPIRGASERALQIGQELLEFCRGPAQRSRAPKLAWFALEPCLESLAQEQNLPAERKGLALTTDFSAVRGWEIHTDQVRFGRILSNLLVNAIRYTPMGRVEFSATWREEDGNRTLVLSVVDTGTGIPREEQESIFQPFERGRAGKESETGGSGLGLAVIDRLKEELGLSLEVFSEYGRGSAFHLLIPMDLLRPAAGLAVTALQPAKG